MGEWIGIINAAATALEGALRMAQAAHGKGEITDAEWNDIKRRAAASDDEWQRVVDDARAMENESGGDG
jgi:hypothetical protein